MLDDYEPRHRGLFWSAVAFAVALVLTGAAVAFVAYQATSGPGGAVRGYFAALARKDAAAALAFGTIPAGPHTLLTGTVLREQQRLAPISDVSVIATEKHARTATVTVQYRLDFADGPQQAVDSVQVVKRGHSWRLAHTAVATRLHVHQAFNRATILGGGVPDGTVLLFPGALPITFDSPYLGIEPGAASVRLSDPGDLDVTVDLTAAGRAAVKAAMTKALDGCQVGGPKVDPRCPLPSDRYVPGSVHGTVNTTATLAKLVITLETDPDGVIAVRGSNAVLRGRFQRLDFNNLPVAGSGTLKLPIDATAFAVEPIVIKWGGGS